MLFLLVVFQIELHTHRLSTITKMLLSTAYCCVRLHLRVHPYICQFLVVDLAFFFIWAIFASIELHQTLRVTNFWAGLGF